MGEDTTATNASPEIRSGSGRREKQRRKEKQKRQKRPLPDPSYTWGVTPPAKLHNSVVGPDHPVHKIPLEKQEKMRAKGINPVLRAEMDEVTKGKRGFWARLGPFFQGLLVSSSAV